FPGPALRSRARSREHVVQPAGYRIEAPDRIQSVAPSALVVADNPNELLEHLLLFFWWVALVGEVDQAPDDVDLGRTDEGGEFQVDRVEGEQNLEQVLELRLGQGGVAFDEFPDRLADPG